MTGDERVVTVGELREAVNACCTCGGAGPGGVCPACDMWYYALRHFAKAPTTPPSAPPLDAKPPSPPESAPLTREQRRTK